MSLLNDALRKKNKELKQPRKVKLFQEKPTERRNDKIKKYGFFVLILFACIVVIWLVWPAIFQPGTSLTKPQITRSKIIETEPTASVYKPARPQVPLESSNEEALAPDMLSQTIEPSDKAKSKIDTVAAMSQKQDSNKDDKVIPMQIGELKSDGQKPIMPLKTTALKTVDEIKGGKKSGVQKRRKADSSHGSEAPFYLKAVSYHKRNELGKAIQMYQEVLRKNPEHYEALFNLASVYLKVSSFSEAYNILQKLHELDPENAQILLNLAIAEIGLGRPRKAISHLNDSDALKDKPQFEICFHKGVAMSKLHMLNEAEIWYKRAEELNPSHPRLLFNMALLYDKLQRYKEALRYYGAFLKNKGEPSVHEKRDVENRINAIRVYMAGQSA
jgi:tetratricopeptide (TPR) repeat protein